MLVEMTFFEKNIYQWEQKIILIFTASFLLIGYPSLKIFAKDLVVDASELFSYPGSISLSKDKNKTPNVLTADENVKPVNISESSSEKIFNSDNEIITINNFPVSPTEKATVELIKSTPAVRYGTNWTIVTAEGEKQLKSFEPAFYVGKIQNNKHSNVTVLYYAGNMYCIIERDGSDNYSISPAIEFSEKELHILTSQNSSLLGKDFNPFLDVHLDEEPTDYELIKVMSEKEMSTDLLQADIIIEATNDFYKLFNNLDKCTAYIAAVMSHTSQIFESNVYIQLFVPQVIIHQDKSKDPYNTTTQIYERLYQLRDQWRKKTTKRAIVCLMTDIDYQGGSGGYRVGGVSLGLGTLCSNNEGYCVFGMQGHYYYPTNNYTWDVSVSAHELGHAFGSPHTHSCYFRPNMIDTCITRDKPQAGSDGCVTTGNPIPRLGTLMSYCHLTNSTGTVALYFHERQTPIIRGFSENASCLKSAIDPTLILLNPSGGTVLFPGDVINIKWASSKIEYVGIKYSLDNGTTWQWIEKFADALSGNYIWSVPDTFSTNLKVFIQDSYNSYVYDETETALTIDKPLFILQSPKESTRIGQDEKYKIVWEQKYLGNFLIEFNPEADKLNSGEESWTVIASGLSGTSYDWDVPDIESNQCLIRIKGYTESGTEFIQVSGKFAIGKPSLKISYPSPYERLCAGQDYEIKWESDFISGMYVQYSTDGGEKWRQVKFSPINGFDGLYKWTVPAIYTDSCFLRFSNFNNRNIIYAVSDKPFAIDSCETSIIDFGNKNDKSLLQILNIVPNPAAKSALVSFDYQLENSRPVEIFITNETGDVIETFQIGNTEIGLNLFNLNIENLSQGNYYLIVSSGNYKTGASLKVLK